jgi:signal transduction histidine kinase
VIGKDLSFLSPELKGFENIIKEVQKGNEPRFIHEHYLSDASNRFFDISIYPLISPDQGGVVFTAVDITEKKHMEIQLIHAQKMETIGELAGGVAHDFTYIHTGISGNEAMLKFTEETDKRRRYIDTLEKITDRAKDLIQQMLVFTKRNEGKPENIAIGQVIEEVMGMASKSVPKSIDFNIGVIGEDLFVYIDHTQLTQVLLNLIVNAKDAIGGKHRGCIGIEVMPITADRNMKRQYLLNTVGRHIRIDVTDNGCGMSKDILPKISTPLLHQAERDEQGHRAGPVHNLQHRQECRGQHRSTVRGGKGIQVQRPAPGVQVQEQVGGSRGEGSGKDLQPEGQGPTGG